MSLDTQLGFMYITKFIKMLQTNIDDSPLTNEIISTLHTNFIFK